MCSFNVKSAGLTFCIIHVISWWLTVASLAIGHCSTCPSTSNNFIFSSLWSNSESQLSKYRYVVVCEISWCRCQQFIALLISTALVSKLLVMEQLLHPALKSTMSALWHNFHLCTLPLLTVLIIFSRGVRLYLHLNSTTVMQLCMSVSCL